MDKRLPEGVQTLPDVAIWETVFSVAPLVLVGTREEDGAYDLAPKHLAFPMSWEGTFRIRLHSATRYLPELPTRGSVHGQLPACIAGGDHQPGSVAAVRRR